MSNTNSISLDNQLIHSLLLPSFPSQLAAETHFKSIPTAWESFQLLPASMQQELMNFCLGKRGLKITYDSVFRKVFNPETEQGMKRLESLLSAILEHNVKIIRIIPRAGTQLNESAGFVVMDILVQLNDHSYANVEMQKIGYHFPLARADCYISDIIMRQYVDRKITLGKKFTFNDLQKVYSIIIMEQSPKEFHSIPGKYIHRRRACFDTGIYSQNAGLHEDIFLCLDTFHSIVHNITKNSSILEAWMTFLSATEPDSIHMLIDSFPWFAPIYQEITNFVHMPKELIDMLSEELYIMDRNLERLMVSELQEEISVAVARRDNAVAALNEAVTSLNEALTARNDAMTERDNAMTERNNAMTERDNAMTERDIYKLYCQHHTPEEIASQLRLTTEYVNSVLNNGIN